ncbi:MAG TPA: head-tail connector protein [Alphaproteobacteria bacterium]|nr:head-tail connector protein [Alphaproteobacteria bacterium]
MAAGDLTSLDNVKAWLAIPSNQTTDDTLLTRLITAASGYIQTWLGRTLALASYTETRDGTGGRRLAFLETPAQSVASVMVDGIAVPASPGPPAPGYVFDASFLTLIGYRFARGPANVLLSYQAGYASTPAEVEQACIELVSLRYRERDRIGQVSKGLAGETVTFAQKDMSDDIRTILSAYQRVTSS